MANLVKTKLTIGIASFGVLVLIFILLARNESTLVYKRWGTPLTWNDFSGPVPWLSPYGASISSTVLLEFDTTVNGYLAYAGQANSFSWTKENQSDYVLNHEQYHFNITELHARQMNDYIRENPGKSKAHYEVILSTFLNSLDYMQDNYDEQNNHGMKIDIQRHWEFKIDSMLTLHSPDSGWVTDVYSGARIFFPSPPETISGLVGNRGAYRRMILKKYDTRLILDAYQIPGPGISEAIINYYKKDSIKVTLSTNGKSDSTFLLITGTDSLNYKIHDVWTNNGSYTYRIAARYPLNGDTLGFYQIANSFINSFSITNTDSYWAKKIDGLEVGPEIALPKESNKGKKESTLPSCLKFGKKEVYGFYRGPIHLDNGGLLIAFDIIRHADSLRTPALALLPDMPLAMAFKQKETFYYIPKDLIPKKTFQLPFGYSLKADSVNQCYTFYGQAVDISPTANN